MSWDRIREICFGCLGIDPQKFYLYRVQDLWSMLKGWDDNLMFELAVERRKTEILATVFNATMGGQGAGEFVRQAMPLPTDQQGGSIPEMTPEERSALIERAMRLREQKRKQNGR